jgi:hypothetical protein
MRKIYLVFAIVITLSSSLLAQNGNPKGSRSSSNRPISPIATSLSKQLNLDAAQQTKTNDAVYSFVVEKKKAYAQNKGAGLQKNKAAKTAIINTAISNFNNQLKTIFTAPQYSAFLGLKPKTNDPKNPLSFLFY